MGTSSHTRQIKPVHKSALLRAYRKLLGELRYYRSTTMAEVAKAKQGQAQALAEALAVCFPDLNLSAVTPLRYRPPVPLPGMRLKRAISMILRRSAGPLKLAELVSVLVDRYELAFHDAKARANFTKRVKLQRAELKAEQAARELVMKGQPLLAGAEAKQA